MLDWILAGVAATYLHKKFPKQTEAVAKGVFKATEFVARKAYDGLSKGDGRVVEAHAIDAIDTKERSVHAKFYQRLKLAMDHRSFSWSGKKRQLNGGAEDWQAAITYPSYEGLALTLFQPRSRRGFEAYGYTDQSGRTVIQPQFSAAGSFSNGLAAVRPMGNRRWGYINRFGDLVIPAQFDHTGSFTSGFRARATVSQGGSIWQIDRNGRRCS
jgi:hypothetical protein